MGEGFYDNFEQEENVSVSDEIVGIFTEPTNIFSKIKNRGVKTVDWLLPILIFAIVVSIINFLSLNDPEIRMQIQEKQMTKIEKNFQTLVENGTMTQEQADQQIDKISSQMDEQFEKGKWIQFISTILVTFVLVLFLAGFFMLVIKFGFKGSGTFKDALVAYGLPYYVLTFGYIIVGLLMFLLGRPLNSLSLAALLNVNTSSLTGVLLAKLDIIGIWFYALIGIGFAKMFNVKSVTKVVAWIFIIWIGFAILLYFAGQAFPFLRLFGF